MHSPGGDWVNSVRTNPQEGELPARLVKAQGIFFFHAGRCRVLHAGRGISDLGEVEALRRRESQPEQQGEAGRAELKLNEPGQPQAVLTGQRSEGESDFRQDGQGKN